MKYIDTTSIDVPTVGKLVKEDIPATVFVDNRIYALKSCDKRLVEEGNQTFVNLMKSMDEKDLLNRYDFEVLDKLPDISNSPRLSKAIDEEKCQFIMSLNTPNLAEKHYLLLRTDKDRIVNDIAMMIYTSEHLSKHSVYEMLHRYAKENPTNFCHDINSIIKNEHFWRNCVSSVAMNRVSSVVMDWFSPIFGIRPSMPDIKQKLNIDGIITYQQKKKIMGRMMANIKKIRKTNDPKAEAELNYIIMNLDIESIKDIIKNLPPSYLALACKKANPEKLGEESDVKLIVKYMGKDKEEKYSLFLHKGQQHVPVHFRLRDSFIVYLIYLIDKHESDNVDTIDIKLFEKEFNKLFKAVYGQDKGRNLKKTEENDDKNVKREEANRFKRLIRKYDQDGNQVNSQLNNCFHDIRSSISKACEQLKELPSPFILSDAYDHLHMQKNKINIPDSLIELMKNQ